MAVPQRQQILDLLADADAGARLLRHADPNVVMQPDQVYAIVFADAATVLRALQGEAMAAHVRQTHKTSIATSGAMGRSAGQMRPGETMLAICTEAGDGAFHSLCYTAFTVQ